MFQQTGSNSLRKLETLIYSSFIKIKGKQTEMSTHFSFFSKLVKILVNILREQFYIKYTAFLKFHNIIVILKRSLLIISDNNNY